MVAACRSCNQLAGARMPRLDEVRRFLRLKGIGALAIHMIVRQPVFIARVLGRCRQIQHGERRSPILFARQT